jgi:hypothetical protein
MSPPSGLDSGAAAADGGDLDARIAEQGNLVRQLKADKKDKQEVDAAVKLLLELKVCDPVLYRFPDNNASIMFLIHTVPVAALLFLNICILISEQKIPTST